MNIMKPVEEFFKKKKQKPQCYACEYTWKFALFPRDGLNQDCLKNWPIESLTTCCKTEKAAMVTAF